MSTAMTPKMPPVHLVLAVLVSAGLAVTGSDTTAAPWEGTARVTVATNRSQYTTDEYFVSFMYGSNLFKRQAKFNCDLTSQRMYTLGTALAPATIRIGGTPSHDLIFDSTNMASLSALEGDQYYMTGHEWSEFTDYTKKVGMNVMFNLNLFLWENATTRETWDQTNAKSFLDYSQERNISIPYFQLGNEVNSYPHKFNFAVTPEELIKHFQELRKLLPKYPLYNSSQLVGPDVTNIIKSTPRNYLTEFIEADGNNAVDVIGLHQYYCDGKTAELEEFLSPSVMDQLHRLADNAHAIVRSVDEDIPVWLSETSSCHSGGAAGLSDSYVAGFLWLDKLGVSASRGIDRVVRTLYCGVTKYSIIHNTHHPLPDYYLTVLYKRLVLGPVLSVTFEPRNEGLRVYAHCARTDFYNYPAGAIVVYYLNTMNAHVNLTLEQFRDLDLHLFQLSPINGTELSNTWSVNLNGAELQMTSDTSLPPLVSETHRGDVQVSPYGFGFVVVPHARVSLCGEESTTVSTTPAETESTPPATKPSQTSITTVDGASTPVTTQTTPTGTDVTGNIKDPSFASCLKSSGIIIVSITSLALIYLLFSD